MPRQHSSPSKICGDKVRESCCLIEIWHYERCGYKQIRLIKRSSNMLLMSTTIWIFVGVAAVILAVTVGTKIKDKYY